MISSIVLLIGYYFSSHKLIEWRYRWNTEPMAEESIQLLSIVSRFGNYLFASFLAYQIEGTFGRILTFSLMASLILWNPVRNWRVKRIAKCAAESSSLTKQPTQTGKSEEITLSEQ